MLYFFLLVVCHYFASFFCNTHNMFLLSAICFSFPQSNQSAISVDSNIMHSSLSICLSLLRIFKILSIRPMSVSVYFSSCNPSIPSLKRLLFSVSVWTKQITSIFCLVFVCYCTAVTVCSGICRFSMLQSCRFFFAALREIFRNIWDLPLFRAVHFSCR